jgi:hypothetical protein
LDMRSIAHRYVPHVSDFPKPRVTRVGHNSDLPKPQVTRVGHNSAVVPVLLTNTTKVTSKAMSMWNYMDVDSEQILNEYPWRFRSDSLRSESKLHQVDVVKSFGSQSSF